MDWQETGWAFQIRAGGSAISGWRVFHLEAGSPKTLFSELFSPDSLMFLEAQHGFELVPGVTNSEQARNTQLKSLQLQHSCTNAFFSDSAVLLISFLLTGLLIQVGEKHQGKSAADWVDEANGD